MEKARNMNVYVEVHSLDGINEVIGCLRSQGIHIYDVDIERDKKALFQYPNAVFSVRLNRQQSHAKVVAMLSKLECISTIKEI